MPYKAFQLFTTIRTFKLILIHNNRVGNWNKNMAGRIKLFQHLQRYYFQAMGIFLSQSNQKCSPNWRNLSTAFFIAQLFLAAFAYLLFKANSTFEYGTNFYVSISESCCLSYFFIQYRQMPKISKLIESCEEFIEKSE